MKDNKKYRHFIALLTVLTAPLIFGVLTSCKNGMTEQIPSNTGRVIFSDISFDGKTFAKTSFTEIVAKGAKAEIFMDDDSSWKTYCNGGEDTYIPGLYLLRGVFSKVERSNLVRLCFRSMK